MRAAKKRREPKWDEHWCLVALRIESPIVRERDQCEHANAGGRYVVHTSRGWHCFDPGTKLQALSWVNRKPERQARIRWLCFECGEIMPLSDQIPPK